MTRKDQPPGCLWTGAGGVDPRLLIGHPKAVVGGRLAVKMVAVLERDLRIVGDDFIVARGLQEENVLKGDARELLKARAGLDRVVEFELALVDEDMDRLVV